jgi:hypothetical protein
MQLNLDVEKTPLVLVKGIKKRTMITGYPKTSEYILFVDQYPLIHHVAWRRQLDVSLKGCKSGSKTPQNKFKFIFWNYGDLIATVKTINYLYGGTVTRIDDYCWIHF